MTMESVGQKMEPWLRTETKTRGDFVAFVETVTGHKIWNSDTQTFTVALTQSVYNLPQNAGTKTGGAT